MHASLPDWLLNTGIQPDSDVVSKRAASITKLVASMTAASSPDLVRVALGGQARHASFDKSFTEAFQETDASFIASHTFERRTLAAATIAELLEESFQAPSRRRR